MAGKRQRLETEGLQYKAHIASMEVMKMWLGRGGVMSGLPDIMPPFAESVGGGVTDEERRGDRVDPPSHTSGEAEDCEE